MEINWVEKIRNFLARWRALNLGPGDTMSTEMIQEAKEIVFDAPKEAVDQLTFDEMGEIDKFPNYF